MKIQQIQNATRLRLGTMMTWSALGVVLIGLGGGCRQSPPKPLPPPIVEVMQMNLTNVPRTADFIGQLDSPQNVEIRARVEAFVESIRFKEGSEVKAGDPLFALDPKPFQEQLAAAQGALAETEAALEKYRSDVRRLEPLAKKMAIPLQDLDNARASVSIGEANVLSAKARVESAQIDLGYCDVRAPVDGLIGAKQVSVGNLVGKGEPTLMATISTLNPIWFYCAISEVDYLRAERTAKEAGRQLGELPVTLILADGTEHPAPGRWVFVDRAVDVSTATIRARCEFPNPDKLLRPGMFARIRIHLHNQLGNLLVPERALTELQGQYFVWVIDAANKATQRPVTVAPVRVAGGAVVLTGLKPGERIVVEGLQKVREGGEVKPLTAAELAAAMAQARAGAAKPGATPSAKD
jgi:membrane fusion protein (multidrug efflux system)